MTPGAALADLPDNIDDGAPGVRGCPPEMTPGASLADLPDNIDDGAPGQVLIGLGRGDPFAGLAELKLPLELPGLLGFQALGNALAAVVFAAFVEALGAFVFAQLTVVIAENLGTRGGES